MAQHAPDPDSTNSQPSRRGPASSDENPTAAFTPSDASADGGLDFLGKPESEGELGRLAHYRVIKELGRGGMGCVLLAEDTRLERKVALKVMLPRFAQDVTAKERFLREARAAAKIHHEHVITIFQVDEDRGAPFIALEFLEGAPLDRYLKNKGALPLPTALRIAREMAEGLAAAHKQGLIHRDIKPGNVWLEASRGKVKILDFGLARRDSEDTHLTQSGAILGTPAFMAPEQARAEKVDARSDLFSLGVVLYRMVTGKQPFSGSTTMAVLTSIAVDTPPPARQANPLTPESLEKVLARLLQKDPAQRYAMAKDVSADLLAVSKELTDKVEGKTQEKVLEARPPNFPAIAPPSAPQVVPKERRASRRAALLIAVAIGLIGTSIGTWQIVTWMKAPAENNAKIEAPDKIPPPSGIQFVPPLAEGRLTGLLDEGPPLPGVKRWNVDTRYARAANHATFSPDSKYMLAAAGRQMRIYEAPSLKLVRILPDHAATIVWVAWSPDGKWIAGTDGNSIRLYDAATGKPGAVLEGHSGPVREIAWTADSNHLATIAEETSKEKVFLWSTDGVLAKKIYSGRPAHVRCHPTTPSLLLVQEWFPPQAPFMGWTILDWNSGEVQSNHPEATHAVWSWDGAEFLVTSSNFGYGKEKLAVFDASGKESRNIYGNRGFGDEFQPRPRSDQYLDGATLRGIKNGQAVASMKVGRFSFYTFSPDGNLFLCGGGPNWDFGSIALNQVASDEIKRLNLRPLQTGRLEWNPDGASIATDFRSAGAPFQIAVWNFASPNPRMHALSLTEKLDDSSRQSLWRCLAWEPGGKRLLCNEYRDDKIALLDAGSGKVDRVVDVDKKYVFALSMAYAGDGKQLAMVFNDKVGIWEFPSYAFKEMIDLGDRSEFRRAYFVGSPPTLIVDTKRWNAAKREWEDLKLYPSNTISPDGSLAAHTWLRAMQIKELSTGTITPSSRLPANVKLSNYRHNPAWSPDSQILAQEADGFSIALFQRNGKFLRLLDGPTGSARAMQFAPDGSPRFAATGDDHAVRVWNTETGRLLSCGVQLSSGQAAIVDDQGDIRFGDPAAVERELIYLLEYEDGRTAVLTPSAFRREFRK